MPSEPLTMSPKAWLTNGKVPSSRGHGVERLAGELPRARRPVGRILGHGAGEHVAELARQVRADVVQRRRRLVDVRPDLLEVAVTLVGHRSGQGLIEHAGERVDVRPAV